MLDDPNYKPRRLLNWACSQLGMKNYYQLSLKLKLHHSTVFEVSNRNQVVTPKLIIALLDAIPQLSIADLRELAGMPKGK